MLVTPKWANKRIDRLCKSKDLIIGIDLDLVDTVRGHWGGSNHDGKYCLV